MGRAIGLREDFDGAALRRLAKGSKDAGQSRRLLALAEIYDGGRRKDAARIGDVGLQVIRDWVMRFNTNGPDGLIDGKATGKPSKLNDAQRQALARIVESGPIPAIQGVVRCRRNLCSAKGDQDSFAARVEPDWQPGIPDSGRGVAGHRAVLPEARGIAAVAAHVGDDR